MHTHDEPGQLLDVIDGYTIPSLVRDRPENREVETAIEVRGTRFPWTPDKPLSWRQGDQGDEPEEAAQA